MKYKVFKKFGGPPETSECLIEKITGEAKKLEQSFEEVGGVAEKYKVMAKHYLETSIMWITKGIVLIEVCKEKENKKEH